MYFQCLECLELENLSISNGDENNLKILINQAQLGGHISFDAAHPTYPQDFMHSLLSPKIDESSNCQLDNLTHLNILDSNFLKVDSNQRFTKITIFLFSYLF